MYHWPAVVVEALFPQAAWHRVTSVPARYLRERLSAAIDLVEAAVQSEETETAMDDAEALSWQLRDLVLQCEAPVCPREPVARRPHVRSRKDHSRETQALAPSIWKTISPVATFRYAGSHRPLSSWNRQPRKVSSSTSTTSPGHSREGGGLNATCPGAVEKPKVSESVTSITASWRMTLGSWTPGLPSSSSRNGPTVTILPPWMPDGLT